MSGWKIVTRELHKAGRPLLRTEFAQNPGGSDVYCALREAHLLGLVESKRHKYTCLWHLTDKGRAWAEGGIEIAIPKPMSQGGKRTAVATWLMALPRTNEVRI